MFYQKPPRMPQAERKVIKNILIGLIIVALSVAAGFMGGCQFERGRQQKNTVKQLTKDAVVLPKIEAKAHEREIKTVERVRIVRELVDNCVNSAMPDAITAGMRDAGIATRQ